MSDVEELAAKTLHSAIGVESRILVVDFWSPWCAPCRTLKPHLSRLAACHAGRARFVAVNVAQDEELARQMQVQSLPTLLVFHDGKERYRFTGAEVLPGLSRVLQQDH